MSNPYKDRVNKRYEELVAEYLKTDLISTFQNEKNELSSEELLEASEKIAVEHFLSVGCGCDRNCHNQFSEKELLSTRSQFRFLSLAEKNCYILAQLRSFSKHSDRANSSRAETKRKRQKFEYQINVDRPVCREAFLFYHDETKKRLERLQDCLNDSPISPPLHGNTGRQPISTYSLSDRELARTFITNFAEIQGLPDPGRDVRKGKCLRILLPSVLNYTSIHKLYDANIVALGKHAMPYRTFLDFWQKELPHICFNDPKTDLCMSCENFKKEINSITGRSTEKNSDAEISIEKREQLLADVYQKALDHLHYVRRERTYYKAHCKEAALDYEKTKKDVDNNPITIANSRNIIMSYSWDFAQQLQYPFEDQQVGPIYFKTPRRAQLFGVCCEGSFKQINYLIDEADFLDKDANTVISLLDHFFSNYGLGEITAYLTADNCVGQNKNNALIQYLMYRILSNLHSRIEMSFLVVGHTKFSPDSHFGLIKQRYRRSSVYTYAQLATLVETSARIDYNHCQRYNNTIIYRDWTKWLSKYFKKLPGIKKYQHFIFDKDEKKIIVKTDLKGEEIKIDLIKTQHDFKSTRCYPPDCISPAGISVERQWYLYDKIREHIPDEAAKNLTCPRPSAPKPKADKESSV